MLNFEMNYFLSGEERAVEIPALLSSNLGAPRKLALMAKGIRKTLNPKTWKSKKPNNPKLDNTKPHNPKHPPNHPKPDDPQPNNPKKLRIRIRQL